MFSYGRCLVLVLACVVAQTARAQYAVLDDAGSPTTMMCCMGSSCSNSIDSPNSQNRALPPINLAATGAMALVACSTQVTNSEGITSCTAYIPSVDAQGLCKMLLDMTLESGSPCVEANYGDTSFGIDPRPAFTPVGDWSSKLSVTSIGGLTGIAPCPGGWTCEGSVCSEQAARSFEAGSCSDSSATNLFAPEVYDITLNGVCLDGTISAGSSSMPGILWMVKARGITIASGYNATRLLHSPRGFLSHSF